MAIAEIVDIKKATFIGLQENHIICDVEWAEPKKVKQWVEDKGKSKKKMVTYHPMTLGAKLKLDISNPKLLEKAKALNPKDEIYIKYHVPKSEHTDDLKAWTVIDILDEIDLLELQMNNQNENALFSIPGDKERIDKILEDKRVEYSTKKPESKKKISSKDKKIAELEQENAQLKLQIQKLKKQLEN